MIFMCAQTIILLLVMSSVR